VTPASTDVAALPDADRLAGEGSRKPKRDPDVRVIVIKGRAVACRGPTEGGAAGKGIGARSRARGGVTNRHARLPTRPPPTSHSTRPVILRDQRRRRGLGLDSQSGFLGPAGSWRAHEERRVREARDHQGERPALVTCTRS